MHDRHLEAFIKVVELGSFAKAGEALLITPNAVIKQVNILERDLGVRLLDRSHRGVVPTAAGRAAYESAVRMVAESRAVMDNLRRIADREKRHNVVRFAASVMRPAGKVSRWWSAVADLHAGISLRIVPVPDDSRQWVKLFENPGRDFDVSVTAEPSPQENPWLPYYETREISSAPICVAVPLGHTLASRDLVTPDDLDGLRVYAQKTHSTPIMKRLCDEVEAAHPGIVFVDCPPYDVGSYNAAAQEGAPILSCREFGDVHPAFVNVDMDWDYSLKLDLIYPKDCHASVREFVDAICEQARAEAGGCL